MEIDSELLPGKFTQALLTSSKHLSNWLKTNFLMLDNNWWESLVLPALSYQQKQWVDRKQITTIEKLDLAALLRVLDRNWYQFTQKFNFSTQERHYVKEMQTIRNRWTHIDNQDVDLDDAYRDIDTIYRFLQIFSTCAIEIMNIFWHLRSKFKLKFFFFKPVFTFFVPFNSSD